MLGFCSNYTYHLELSFLLVSPISACQNPTHSWRSFRICFLLSVFFYIPSLYTTPIFSESSVSLHPSYDIYNILFHTNITFMLSLALLPYCRVFITARRGFCLACKIIGIKYLLNWVIKRWHLYKFFENLSRKSLYKLKMSLFLVILSSHSKTDTWFYYF